MPIGHDQYVLVRKKDNPHEVESVHSWNVRDLGVWSGWEVVPNSMHRRHPRPSR
jgi:hypothetical protein